MSGFRWFGTAMMAGMGINLLLWHPRGELGPAPAAVLIGLLLIGAGVWYGPFGPRSKS